MKKTSKNSRLGWKLALVSVAMFAFGYLMVPLYDVFCELTGLNGKVSRTEVAEIMPLNTDPSRSVTIEFIANRNQSMNWKFEPIENKLLIHPGATYTTHYKVKNLTALNMVGQAVPSVSPVSAAPYLKKIECFCFEEQTLAGGEERDMPIRFVVSPDLPKHLSTISLSYTFFDVTEKAKKQTEHNTETERS